jgi:hypothetical protein
MAFSLEKLFVDVFAPRKGEKVTVMYDVPHGGLQDTPEWRDRRKMAEEWREEIACFARTYGLLVNPTVRYEATGGHSRDLPEYGMCEGRRVRLEDVAAESTIILSMPEFSASAPLLACTLRYENLRVASLPTVTRAMEETGLAADHKKIAATCARLAQLYDRSDGIEVMFSTGDTCYFDKSDHKPALKDDGRLHPEPEKGSFRLRNLPTGEVAVVPKEGPDSETRGRIPVSYGGEIAVFVVQNNEVVDVIGGGAEGAAKREEFRSERAMRNIAEVAIGCNDRAVVTGNVLEDEKAGFHWAYGRSEHMRGTVGPEAFSSPEKVVHQDIVYAKGNPIVCKRFDFIFRDGTRQTVIRDGILDVEDQE